MTTEPTKSGKSTEFSDRSLFDNPQLQEVADKFKAGDNAATKATVRALGAQGRAEAAARKNGQDADPDQE
jgi:hypothetical protein